MEKIVPTYVLTLVDKQKCEGSCEEHRGEVKAVYVHDAPWQMWFAYCDEAEQEDMRRGFRITRNTTENKKCSKNYKGD